MRPRMRPPLVDIGLNLTHDSFDHDREDVLARAHQVGVTYMILTGSDPAQSQGAIRCAGEHPECMRATAGVHPHHASEFASSDAAALKELMQHPLVVAAGECGLDFYRNLSPQADQERVFRVQLELACEVKKPLFLHQRDAHERFVALLKEQATLRLSGVAHCFTSGLDEARHYFDLGLYIGITGWICDERRGQHLRDVVRYIPLDRLLVETDAPYLLPRNLSPMPKSRRNEPMYLPQVLTAVAESRGADVAEIAAATMENTRTLFGWPPPATAPSEP